MEITVFTLPACPKCDVLKGWLEGRGLPYNERAFDTGVHTELIMRNDFGDPPVLAVGSKLYTSDGLFSSDDSIDDEVMETII